MKRAVYWPVLLSALAVLIVLSLMAGRVWVPFSAWSGHADPRWAIIFELRWPRTILAVLVGAALAMSGAALQGFTRNPLADPGILGVSVMAALGAVLSLYFGVSDRAPWLLPAAAMAGAILGGCLLLGLSGLAASTITFVVAGIILQNIGGSLVALALSLAPNPWATQEIIDWLMGSLADRSIDEVRIAAPFILIGLGLIYSMRRALDALTLGEATAASLGVNLKRAQILLVLGIGLATGATVAVTGVISFVGLIVPHILRPFTTGEPGKLLLPSALGGAVLVLAADILVRLTPAAAEVKLGVAMAILGGPFFFATLLSMRRKSA